MYHFLKQAVKEGLVDENRLDEALVNLFTARMKLGVLDREEENPYDKIPYSAVDSSSMQALNREAAARSMVLLKNEGGLLPLDKSSLKTVAALGEHDSHFLPQILLDSF